MDKRLRDMLTYKRPHGSQSEAEWITRFILPYGPEQLTNAKGVTMVYIVTVSRPDLTEPNVLFSAHTDTVHRKSGRQKLVVDEATGFVSEDGKEPLGADDAAGVWLLLEMIDAEIPGVYTFPVGEECGGIGSSWLADNASQWLKGFDYAIAFDRKATHSIITHQARGMCCSDAFALALADALNDQNDSFMYSPDDSGVYTDTAEYVDLIAECTNVSCGYYDEHSGNERLDFKHLAALRDACLLVNWAALPVVRKPGEDDFVPSRFNFLSYSKSARAPSGDLAEMSYREMVEFAAFDPDGFVDLVRSEMGLEDEEEEDEHRAIDEHFRNACSTR